MFLNYSAVVLNVAIMLAIAFSLNNTIDFTKSPFLLAFGSIIFSAFWGGLKAGLLATALSALATFYFFILPAHSGSATPEDWLRLGVFVSEGILFSCLIALLQTAKRKAEADLYKLQTSDEQLRLAVDAACVGTWDWNINTGKITWSKNHELLYGIAPGTFRGNYQAFLEFVHPEDQELATQKIKLALESQRDYQHDFRIIRPDGSIRWISAKGQFSYSEAGKPIRMLGVCADITERKQVEEAWQRTNDRLKLLSETASDLLSSEQPLALIDTLFKKLSAQMSLDLYLNYLVDEDRKRLRLASFSGISSQIAQEIEYLEFGQAICGTVAQQCCQITLSNIPQSTEPKAELLRSLGLQAYSGQPLMVQGQLLGTLCFGSHSRVSFTPNEAALLQTVCDQMAIAMERARLIASLQEQTQQLMEANRLKDDFLATLSHELRAPLTAMLGWAQMLRSRELDEATTVRALEIIDRNARAQKQLIEDLIDVSRIISGKLSLQFRICDLAAIIEVVIDAVRPGAEAKGIQLQSKLAPDARLVSGDSDRLQQAVWNLLSNAIKFTPKGGQVFVSLQRCQFQTKLLVKDTGIGIKPDFLPHVFERFRQADAKSTRSYGGLGLGLAITHHLVELHGGKIGVESAGEGQGATFRIELPLVADSPSLIYGKRVGMVAEEEVLGKEVSLAGLLVLVVDDEADVREFLNAVLLNAQAEVQTAASVKEALTAIAQWQPHLIVSDIAMPEEDGYSLLRQMQLRGVNIPAIALTAYAGAEERARSLQAGFQLHLSKPIKPGELVEAIASLTVANHQKVPVDP